MHLHRKKIHSALAAVIMGSALFGSGISYAQPEAEPQGAEVLTRGPVHEAFAGTISYDPEPGMFVDRQPPVLIEEVPPEQRLEGDNVTWIPGYWAWDDDQNDFLWISGIWRNLPPDREWVPGYWAQVDARWQWTSGYWEDAETTEVSYLPEPPRSLETGPNVEATSNDQTWIPGNWVYREERYAWRPGAWSAARENWVWVPAYYRWTRRGYVYVDGYWDYPVVRRGVVFAPVRFQPAYVARPDFSYSPLTVISLAVFTNHLFVRPSHNHYYFGDYYEPRYRDRDYYASYSYNRGRRGYDPFYAHNRWEHRNDRGWERQREEYFEYRRDNRDARPPRTWAALNSRPQADRERYGYDVADRFDRVANDRKDGRQRFQAVDKKERERYISQRQEIRKFGRDREEMEVRGKNVPEGPGKGNAESRKQKVNRSPVLAKKSDRSDKDGGPPSRIQARASEKDDNDRSAGRGDSNKEKSKEEITKGEGQKRPGGKPEPAVENRTKPGQKRDGKTEADQKREGKPQTEQKREGKPQAEQNREGKPQPDQKRKADQDPQQKDKSKDSPKQQPAPNRQADPTPPRKEGKPEAKPEQNKGRQADPTPKREVAPEPKRQASPEKKADSAPKRQANPEQKGNPAPKREATPEQKAKPAPKRQAEPEQQPKKKEKTEASVAPVRKVQAEPKRQTVAARPAQRPAAKPQPTQARQQKSQPETKGKAQDSDRQKKKKEAE
jgi:hypothetical protein